MLRKGIDAKARMNIFSQKLKERKKNEKKVREKVGKMRKIDLKKEKKIVAKSRKNGEK